MTPIMVFGGNELLNLTLQEIYTNERNRFKASGQRGRVHYSFDVTNLPTGRFITNLNTHNFEVDFTVLLETQGTFVSSQNLAMRATGTIKINNGFLSITQLSVINLHIAPVNALLIPIIDNDVLPPLRNTLRNMPIPQLNNFIGSGFSLNLSSSTVIAPPALEVDCQIVGNASIANATFPSAANLQSLNSGGNPNQANVIAVASDEAINILFKSKFPTKTYDFSRQETGWGFGAGIKMKIRTTSPIININNGIGAIHMTLRIRNIKAGAKGFGKWVWVNLADLDVNVEITNRLIIEEDQAKIKLTGFSRIKVRFRFGGVLKAVEGILEDLVNVVINEFRDLLSDEIRNKKISIFRLPANVLGANLNANASINSLDYSNNSVQAIFDVRI